MIKYFLIFISITISSFSLESGYFSEVNSALGEYNTNETIFEDRQSAEVDLYTEPKNSCTRFAKTIEKTIFTPNDITIFKKREIKPINYTNTISLNTLTVTEKKQKFFNMLLPAILISKQKFRVLRTRAKKIIESKNPSTEDLLFLDKMYKKFKTTNNKELLSRMKTHPVSIVLAQAAIESAWGESRFFKKGNNIFGMWSYDKNEPRMRARKSRNGKYVYLKKYETLSDAIDDYFVTIGRGAYKSFRKHRDITKDPLQLVQYLVELREEYTRKLRKFIIHNRLTKFDKFKIDRKYI